MSTPFCDNSVEWFDYCAWFQTSEVILVIVDFILASLYYCVGTLVVLFFSLYYCLCFCYTCPQSVNTTQPVPGLMRVFSFVRNSYCLYSFIFSIKFLSSIKKKKRIYFHRDYCDEYNRLNNLAHRPSMWFL